MTRRRVPLRICHFVSDDAWGGLEVMVLNLLRAQRADPAYDVSLIALNHGRLYSEAEANGIVAHVLPERELNGWQLGFGLRRVLSSLRPQVLHTHRYKENFFSYLVANGLGIRRIVTLHGYRPSSVRAAGLKTFVTESISNRLARRARTQFVAVSRDLQHLYERSDDECLTIPNGVTVPPLSRPLAERGHQAPVIGWVGRLVPVKSVGTLLEAVAHLNTRGTLLQVLLVGDGSDRAALTEHATRLGIHRQVEFTGHVDDPFPFFRRMDVFALPSLHEGAPMALLEAMAAGVPCVASRVGGIPEMIGNSGAACLVDGQDPVEWAHALQTVLGDRASTDAMVRRAHGLVSERFSIDAMHTSYGALYDAVMNR